MGGEGSDLQQREAELIEELAHLHVQMRQAGLEVPGGPIEAVAIEPLLTREIEIERVRADELRHRLKNTLAVVLAIANSTFRSSKRLDDPLAIFNARLQALGHAHEVLFESDWTSASLTSVIKGVIGPYRVRTKGPDVDLNGRQSLALALALNELATNAVKYGALSKDIGYVNLVWTLTASPSELHLRWHERNGPPVRAPSRKGFGSRLIVENLAAEFDGTVELDFRPDGLMCMIRAPVQELELS